MKIAYQSSELSRTVICEHTIKTTTKKTKVAESDLKLGCISIFSFVQPLFSYGNLVCTFGCNFKQIYSGEVIVTKRRALQVIVWMVQFSSLFHLMFLPPIVFWRHASNDYIRRWVTTLSLFSVLIMTAVMYISAFLYQRVYVDILNSMISLQKKFLQYGLQPLFTILRKRLLILFFVFWFCIGICDFCFLMQYDLLQTNCNGIPTLFNRTNRFYGKVFGSADSNSYNVAIVIMALQFLLAEMFNWQVPRFICSFLTIISCVIREFYKTLNEAMAHCSTELSLQHAMQLHRQTTSLVYLVNKAVSPILFLYLLSVITTACKVLPSWMIVHKSITDFLEYDALYPSLIGLAFVLASSVSINIQAKQASQWLENNRYSLTETSAVCTLDFASFSNNINSNEIGLSGFGFFTITARFVVTILSGVFTYTVLIAQLSNGTIEI